MHANHEKLFMVFGRPYSSRFDVWQVHGKTILFGDAPRPPEKKHPPADGIFTDKPEVTLIMRFADCVPLVFHDPVQKVVGIVHAGWQGTLLRIGAEAVSAIGKRYGSLASDLRVGLGPSICGKCYQVGEEVRQQFLKAWGNKADHFLRKRRMVYSWICGGQMNGYCGRQAWNKLKTQASAPLKIWMSGILTEGRKASPVGLQW